jgi:hypothetical protein
VALAPLAEVFLCLIEASAAVAWARASFTARDIAETIHPHGAERIERKSPMTSLT